MGHNQPSHHHSLPYRLGCRSGSYLLYAVFSTASFACFFTSVLLSRAAVLRAPPSNLPARQQAVRSGSFLILGYSSLVFRLFGLVLAICGSFWIIVTSIWELVGFFDNCWCEGAVLTWGCRISVFGCYAITRAELFITARERISRALHNYG